MPSVRPWQGRPRASKIFAPVTVSPCHPVTNGRSEALPILILMSVLVRVSDIVRTLSHVR
jgi:hypothetical protein